MTGSSGVSREPLSALPAGALSVTPPRSSIAITPMAALTFALSLGALALLSPLWAPVVLGAWFADLLQPLVHGLERLLGGRRRAAGVILALGTVALLAPALAVVASLVSSAIELGGQLRASLEIGGPLGALRAGTAAAAGAAGAPSFALRDWADLASRHGANAWRALGVLTRASASAAIGVLVFVASLYTFAVDHERAYAWLEAHAPIPPAALARLAGAFRETGRGLIVAGGGIALAQGALATVAYLAIGLPRALLLGPLTALCSIIPFVGTGLVWVPLAIGLVVKGQYLRAAVVVAVGAGVHTLVDQLLRPLLARRAHLDLPTFVVLLSMLGGVALMGASGALLGPLVVRMSVEALALTAEDRKRIA